MTRQEILAHVDHTLLKPEATWPQIQALWGLGVKVFSNGLVILLNYLFSKRIIFRPKG